MVLGLLWCNVSFAESVYDYLEKDTDRIGPILYLNTHNKHGSKTIILKTLKIWFNRCENKSGEPNRIYSINRRNAPYSDLQVMVSTSFNYDGAYCYVLSAKFYEPPKTNTTTTYTPPKKKKSGAKKLLEKIIGD